MQILTRSNFQGLGLALVLFKRTFFVYPIRYLLYLFGYKIASSQFCHAVA